MKTSRRRSTGGSAPQRAGTRTDRAARRAPAAAPAAAPAWPDLSREDPHPEPYRPELVARLEQAVREGRYRPEPTAIAAAMIDRMDSLLG